jgi:hypothetical protein
MPAGLLRDAAIRMDNAAWSRKCLQWQLTLRPTQRAQNFLEFLFLPRKAVLRRSRTGRLASRRIRSGEWPCEIKGLVLGSSDADTTRFAFCRSSYLPFNFQARRSIVARLLP